MGLVRPDVLFSTKGNHHRESIMFEVVNHASAYHAILGQPALAKFMAVPHYGYLKMKMPGPHGIITVSGDYKGGRDHGVAETMVCNEEIRQFKRKFSEEQPAVPESAKPAREASFQSARNTKKIYFDESDHTKFVTMGANLDTK